MSCTRTGIGGSIPLNHLPLQPLTLTILQRRGFVTIGEMVASIENGGMEQLAVELNVTTGEAESLFQQVRSCLIGGDGSSHTGAMGNVLGATSARDLLNQRRQIHGQGIQHVVTFCKQIDTILGGGIALGEVTEIVGLPGTGKTQLAMQLCVDARIPKFLGGVHGQAVYLDTEGSFMPQRCYTMAQALVQHVQGTSRRRQQVQQQKQSNTPFAAVPPSFTPEAILNGIHVFRIHSEEEQTATIYSLPRFLQQQLELHRHCHAISAKPGPPPVKLIVIDSFAFHYRASKAKNVKTASSRNPNKSQWNRNRRQHEPHNYYFQRAKSLTTLAAFLAELSTTYNVAVVAVNHMTTKFANSTESTKSSGGTFTSSLVPALGESWAHATNTRLLLSKLPSSSSTKLGAIRLCTLVKHPHRPSGAAYFQIHTSGIRDTQVSDQQQRRLHHQDQPQSQPIQLQRPGPQPTAPRIVTPTQISHSQPQTGSITPTITATSVPAATPTPQRDVTDTAKRARTSY